MLVTAEVMTAPAMVGEVASVNYRHQNVLRKIELPRFVDFTPSLFIHKSYLANEILREKFWGDKDSLLKYYYSARSDNEKKGTSRLWRRK